MPQIKVVSLDLDNTLWDVSSTIRRAEEKLRGWLQSHAPDSLAFYHPESLPNLKEQLVKQYPDKRHDLSFLRIQILTQVMQQAGFNDADARHMGEAAFACFFEWRNRVEFYPGALEMLASLQDRYALYSLTNGNADVQATGIAQFLEGAISSADVGASKPDPAMFEAVLNSSKAAASEVVHIGDHLFDDIQGAQRSGLNAIWVNLDQAQSPEDDQQPAHAVTALNQVLSALERIESQ